MALARTHSGIWVPQELAPAVKRIAVVFYHSKKLNHITIGAPEAYPVPQIMMNWGYHKVVCRTAREVEIWSGKLRDQERREAEKTDEEREAFEGPLRDALRKDLVTRMLNAKDAINREFCRQSIAKIDAKNEEMRKNKRESFQHVEGYEAGH